MTTDNLAKWVDEIAGTIERIQKKLSTFKVNNVEVEPADNDGDQIADITVNGEQFSLNMPVLEVEPEFDEGVKLATITLGEHMPTELYMPKALWNFGAPSEVYKREIADNGYGEPLYEAYIRVEGVSGGASVMSRLIDADTQQDLRIGTLLELDAVLNVKDTTYPAKGTQYIPIGSNQVSVDFQVDRAFAGITKNNSQNNLMVGYQGPSSYTADFMVKIVFSTTEF